MAAAVGAAFRRSHARGRGLTVALASRATQLPRSSGARPTTTWYRGTLRGRRYMRHAGLAAIVQQCKGPNSSKFPRWEPTTLIVEHEQSCGGPSTHTGREETIKKECLFLFFFPALYCTWKDLVVKRDHSTRPYTVDLMVQECLVRASWCDIFQS